MFAFGDGDGVIADKVGVWSGRWLFGFVMDDGKSNYGWRLGDEEGVGGGLHKVE